MKSFGIFAASALFSAIANAAPVNKRAVVWVTETAIDVVTVPVTKTVWAGSEETTTVASTTSSKSRHQFWHSKSSKTSTASSSVYVAPTPSSTSVDAAPTSTSSSSTSVYVAPTTSSVEVAPTTSSTSVYVAPTTSSTSVYVAPTTSSTSVYVAPTTSSVEVAPTTSAAPTLSISSVYQNAYTTATSATSSAAAATTSSSSSSGTSSGPAASGTEYTGDLTWYDVGLGACGETSVDGDKIVAISHTIFDAYSTGNPNTNPLCGKFVTITGKDGSSYQAKVVDRCVGCEEADLDLSHQFFNTVTSNGDGRVSGMSWTWN